MAIIRINDGEKWVTLKYDFHATETIPGMTRIATEDETKLGVDEYKYVTPKTLASVVSELPVEEEVVHKSNTETITGIKTFKGNDNNVGSIKLQSTSLLLNTIVSNTKEFGKVEVFDLNNKPVGYLDVVRGVDGTSLYNSIRLNVYNKDGSNSHTPLELRYNDNGELVGYGPTPNILASGNELVTASWTNTTITNKINELPEVARSGSYNDLKDIPEIKTALQELTDVSLETPNNNQALLFDSELNKWTNKNVIIDNSWGTIGGELSEQKDLQDALDLKANDNIVVKSVNNILPNNGDVKIRYSVQKISSTKIYGTYDELPSLSMDESGTRYLALSNNLLPLKLYEWNFSLNQWVEVCSIDDNVLCLYIDDEILYYYTNNSPYLYPLNDSYTKNETDELLKEKSSIEYVNTELGKKADKTEIPTKLSQLENDNEYITEIPSEYITEEELEDKGYLTEHQDISGKADKETTYTKEEVDTLFDNYIPDVSGKVDRDYLDEQLGLKADKETTYTKEEVDTLFDNYIPDVSTKADITYVDEQLDKKANQETTYTKTETEQLINTSINNTRVSIKYWE